MVGPGVGCVIESNQYTYESKDTYKNRSKKLRSESLTSLVGAGVGEGVGRGGGSAVVGGGVGLLTSEQPAEGDTSLYTASLQVPSTS